MQEEQPNQMRQPWEQMPGEPNIWFGRFQIYLDMGSTRSLKKVAVEAGEQAKQQPFQHSRIWSYNFQRWRWRARAHAWDVHQRSLLALSEHNARIALHSRRVERMEDCLDDVCEVLEAADITNVDKEQARAWLPQMRVFLRDLLVAERQEFERGNYEAADADGGLVITADDMQAAQQILDKQGHGGQPAITPDTTLVPPWRRKDKYPAGRTLYVCVGPDAGLMLDLAALRAVRAATGLCFHRVLDTTRDKLSRTLRRERDLGRPVQLLHIALHASAAGIQFGDGVANGNWLSERLDGVRVLLLASCECDAVGDWLGVVPYVITFSEEISHEDAATLTHAFWHNIGLEMEPGGALDEALTHCAPAVREYVVRHW